MRLIKGLLFLCLLWWAQPSLAFDQEHKAWAELLGKFVDTKGNVGYADWKSDQKSLDTYLQELQGVKKDEFAKWSIPEQKAFLINAYNAFTVKLILKHFPVKSIKDIGGWFSKPWDLEWFSLLEGDIKSLDPIEHEYLRKKKQYFDPRVHAVANCASISCPSLRSEPYVGRRLEEQLTDATKTWLADESKNQWQPDQKKVRISKIFDWYEDDFGGNDAGVIGFLKKYGPASFHSMPDDIKIEYLDYNWQLNRQ